MNNLRACFNLVRLTALLQQSSGVPEIKIGLIDGPVVIGHPDLSTNNIRLAGRESACAVPAGTACQHGTFVAGILSAKRGSMAPAICPGCTLLVRPIFSETDSGNGQMPGATAHELAKAIVETIDQDAHILNLSAALVQSSSRGAGELVSAIDYAAQRGVIVIAAAGNQGEIGSSSLTRHPWVIPVAACDRHGRPLLQSNLGNSIGRRGILAPGDHITSLGADATPVTLTGTSVAAPFVTGVVALLWSEFQIAPAVELLMAVRGMRSPSRVAIIPPLLDAAAAYQIMLTRGYTASLSILS